MNANPNEMSTSTCDRARGNVLATKIQEWLLREIAERMGMQASELDPNVPLIDYGLDSFHATTLSGELSRFLGRDLSPSLLWECPTIRALSQYLVREPLSTKIGPTGTLESSATDGRARIGGSADRSTGDAWAKW